MDTHEHGAALISALTTEHFVLQTAASSTISEAAARSNLYVMVLSSSLVATGFLSQSPALLVPFAAAVLPAVFLLGLFTVLRLVDTGLESMQYLLGIARIRGFYRTLGPEAAEQFAPRNGRWPEAKGPEVRFGRVFAFLSTTASMIAVINSVVGGVGIALLIQTFGTSPRMWLSLIVGAASAILLTVGFLAYQRWRFGQFENLSPLSPKP
jgi:hypothetical protein